MRFSMAGAIRRVAKRLREHGVVERLSGQAERAHEVALVPERRRRVGALDGAREQLLGLGRLGSPPARASAAARSSPKNSLSEASTEAGT